MSTWLVFRGHADPEQDAGAAVNFKIDGERVKLPLGRAVELDDEVAAQVLESAGETYVIDETDGPEVEVDHNLAVEGIQGPEDASVPGDDPGTGDEQDAE